jgi:hypothetical protein
LPSCFSFCVGKRKRRENLHTAESIRCCRHTPSDQKL